MRALVPGDTIVVSKLDRLARSSRDLHNILHELQERGCGFVSLGESWCDSTSEVGRLMLTIMGGIAEFERGLIRKRCEEGIERAKANGKQFGRPTALDHGQRRRVAERYAAGETMAELAREYDCGKRRSGGRCNSPFPALGGRSGARLTVPERPASKNVPAARGESLRPIFVKVYALRSSSIDVLYGRLARPLE